MTQSNKRSCVITGVFALLLLMPSLVHAYTLPGRVNADQTEQTQLTRIARQKEKSDTESLQSRTQRLADAFEKRVHPEEENQTEDVGTSSSVTSGVTAETESAPPREGAPLIEAATESIGDVKSLPSTGLGALGLIAISLGAATRIRKIPYISVSRPKSHVNGSVY